MPVPALDQRHISGVVQRPGDALNHWVNLGRLTLATLKPSAQPYSSRVFWAVMMMQSGVTRVRSGIPSVNPACGIHSPRKNIALCTARLSWESRKNRLSSKLVSRQGCPCCGRHSYFTRYSMVCPDRNWRSVYKRRKTGKMGCLGRTRWC